LSGRSLSSPVEGVRFHAQAVAVKTRQRKKQGTSGARRRVSKSSSTAGRKKAGRTAASGSSKPKLQGAKRHMTATNNKKTNATAAANKKAAERAKKPVEHAKKPAEEVRKALNQLKKPAATVARKPQEAAVIKSSDQVRAVQAIRKPVEQAKRPADVHARKPAEQIRKPVEAHPTAKKPVEPLKKTNQRQGFRTHEFIVYPAHGVGQIVAIEEQEVAGYKLELFVISFAKDKMTLRVPTMKVASVGMRKLAEPALVRRALETLKGRARIKRTMWSRRAQEYEAKINSGDIVAIAEVVRDLYRSDSQPEQSYSERQLYEAALDRLAREIGAVERITETEAIREIEGALAKGPRRGKPAEGAEASAGADEEEFVAEEAA
jgi:CarD family transcriptional regulator